MNFAGNMHPNHKFVWGDRQVWQNENSLCLGLWLLAIKRVLRYLTVKSECLKQKCIRLFPPSLVSRWPLCHQCTPPHCGPYEVPGRDAWHAEMWLQHSFIRKACKCSSTCLLHLVVGSSWDGFCVVFCLQPPSSSWTTHNHRLSWWCSCAASPPRSPLIAVPPSPLITPLNLRGDYIFLGEPQHPHLLPRLCGWRRPWPPSFPREIDLHQK